MRARLVSVSLADARRFVGANHRHNRAPVSWKFGVGLESGGRMLGVVMAGRPVARKLDQPGVIEVTRLCTVGEPNACTRLYGAICRAARDLGYHTAYTYTLASEPGSSLRAAGWEIDETLPPRPTWDTPARRRVQTDLFGEPTRPEGAKLRWVRRLATPPPAPGPGEDRGTIMAREIHEFARAVNQPEPGEGQA